MICAALCFLIFLAFDEKAFVGKINGPALALLMFLYGWAMIPLMYPFSRMFKVSFSVIALLAQVQAVSQQLLSVTSIVMSINEQLCCWWDMLVTFPHCSFDWRSQKYSVKNLICYHWLNVLRVSKIMHRGIISDISYWWVAILIFVLT